jgi:hypothetical protein
VMLQVHISDEDAHTYWKAGMLPNPVLNAVSRALEKERPADLNERPAPVVLPKAWQPDLFTEARDA